MATSTKTNDYMGRDLINATPGVTNPVKDYVGRQTTSTADYAARLLADNPLGTISGVITDADGGDPIDGATVTAAGRTATTNGDGEYTLTPIQAATYTVTAVADGYDTTTLEGVVVEVAEDLTAVDLELDASD